MTNFPTVHYVEELCISGDDSKIAFTYGSVIFVINSDGSGLTQVTESIDVNLDSSLRPSINGDGSIIAFISDQGSTTLSTTNIFVAFFEGEIPEFPSLSIMLIALTFVAVVGLYKKKLTRKVN